jgi:hypothetical protein
MAVVRTSAVSRKTASGSLPAKPFVTISRQAGAGGKSLGQHLVQRLNEGLAQGQQIWTCWDRELVEKVASDHHLSKELIDFVTETGRSWIDRLSADFVGTLAGAVPDDLVVYRRVASTIRGLAETGHVVIVGRGGMRVTQDLAGGLHLRLVAPREHRELEIARRQGVSVRDASAYVTAVDRGRALFYERLFPGVKLDPEHFSVTLNTAALNESQIVTAVVPLLESGTLLAPLNPRGKSAVVHEHY